MRARVSVWLAASLATSLLACFGPSLPTSGPCGANGLCPPGQLCDTVRDLCVADGSDIDEPELECDTDADCGAHEICRLAAPPTAVCECAAGYALGGGGECLWDGVIADPSFETTSVWATDGVIFNPIAEEPGLVDPGLALFTADAMCRHATLRQTIEMPSLAAAEPLAVEINHKATTDGEFGIAVGAAIGFGDTWVEIAPSRNDWRTDRVCLGDASFDGSIDLSIGPAAVLGCAGDQYLLAIDHISIDVAEPGECPPVGGVFNGDAEGAGGWQFSLDGSDSVGQFTEGVGESDSRAAEIRVVTTCQSATVAINVSPSSDPQGSPALRLWWNDAPSSRHLLRLREQTLIALGDAPPAQAITSCLPLSTVGAVQRINATIDAPAPCDQPTDVRLYLDSVDLIDEPACGTVADQQAAGIFDPGFESAPLRPPFTANDGTFAVAKTLRDPGTARTGAGVLELAVRTRCRVASYSPRVVAPPANPGEGPALTFFYNYADPSQTSARVSSLAGSTTLQPNGGWREGSVCLRPELGRRPQDVIFRLDGGPGTCDDEVVPAERLLLDDFTVISTPACAP